MATKEKLLALFEENKGIYISGEEIAEKLSISRTAVWKGVKSLRSDGYKIDAVQNKGYSLSVETDIISVQGIEKYLNPKCRDLSLTVFPTVESTNAAVIEKASAGAKEGLVILANSQTKGKGRVGRTFYSPTDTGIYLSILLRPVHYSAQQAVKFTTMAAVAACESIEAISEQKTMIKWVNDIYINGKKVGGILTEAAISLESGFLDYIVMGIGINVYTPPKGFPPELSNIAGAVFSEHQRDGKNRLAAEFLNRFMAYYFMRDKESHVEKYRKRGMVTGKQIDILSKEGNKKAYAKDIDDECRLIVRYGDGTEEKLYSGEISIRLS